MVGIRKLCTPEGGISTGRRPGTSSSQNARYSAEWLALRTDLLGKLLWLQLEDEDDAMLGQRVERAGELFGVVRAAPPWNRSPHTPYMRQAIRALDKRRACTLTRQCDAVDELIRYARRFQGKKLPPHPAYLEARRVLQKHARNSSRAAHMLARADTPPTTSAAAVSESPSSPSRPTSRRPAAHGNGEDL